MIFKGHAQFSQSRQAEQGRCCLVTLPLYQRGHRCLAGQFLQPVQVQCSFQDPQDQGARQGVLCCLLCTTHIALVASFNLPNHFGRKWHPHGKRREFPSGRETCCRSHSQHAPSWDPSPGLRPAEAGPQPGTTWQWGSPPTAIGETFHQLIACEWLCVTEGQVRFLCNSDAVNSEWPCCECLTWSRFIVLVWDEFTVKTKKDPEKAGFIWLNPQRWGCQGWLWCSSWRHCSKELAVPQSWINRPAWQQSRATTTMGD